MTKQRQWVTGMVCLPAALAGGFAGSVNAQAQQAITEISVEHTPCFGTCPAYKVTLRRDGTATFVGRRFADKTGTYRADVGGFSHLAQAFGRPAFWRLKPRYAIPITDAPGVITSVVRGGHRRTVTNYGDAGPQELWELQALVDGAVAQAKWTQDPPPP